MATFNLPVPGAICCHEKANGLIEPGDILRLTLDGVKYPNLLVNPIDAAINSITEAKVWDPETEQEVDGYIYNVTVDDSDMPVVNGSVLMELDLCDIINWACKSCCDVLADQIASERTELEVITDVVIEASQEDPNCLKITITKTTIEFVGEVTGGPTSEVLNGCLEVDPYASVSEEDFNWDVQLPEI